MGLLKRVIDDEAGQALPIVLVLLVLGGLMITPSLNYAATALNYSRTIDKSIHGLYAADAGVEDALWHLQNGIPPSQQLSENIDQMELTMQTEDKGTCTAYCDTLVEASGHSDYLSVDGEIIWDEEAAAYKYTITVNWEGGSSTIHLKEVGARLPLDYSYQPGSAASFANNLSTAEPEEILDSSGARVLNWAFAPPPYPSVTTSNPQQTQTFYITGEGGQSGHFAWVVAVREDIGTVGEITGNLYRITATARQPGNSEITGRIVADVIVAGGATHIISWQISK